MPESQHSTIIQEMLCFQEKKREKKNPGTGFNLFAVDLNASLTRTRTKKKKLAIGLWFLFECVFVIKWFFRNVFFAFAYISLVYTAFISIYYRLFLSRCFAGTKTNSRTLCWMHIFYPRDMQTPNLMKTYFDAMAKPLHTQPHPFSKTIFILLMLAASNKYARNK